MELTKLNVLIIIPARGGSKGIPRKNLRPVAGKPLIYYSIQAALSAKLKAKVFVSTDDEEIGLLAERFGASVLIRESNLADDKTTLDPVILDALSKIEGQTSEYFDAILTVQPTSPLISPNDISGAYNQLMSEALDTVLTVVDDRHLCWSFDGDKPVPAYQERVNRQELPKKFKETGAVIACSRDQLLLGTRIGKKVGLYEVSQERSFDIDTISDLYLCEAILSRKRIVFNVVGYPAVGLGHAFRAVMLANELVKYEIIFVCGDKSKIAADYIKTYNYDVVVSDNDEDSIANTIIDLNPDMVINDVLDTSANFMTKMQNSGFAIVNFEDMGEGAKQANLVINALYPHQVPEDKFLIGPDYFCLRDEFLFIGNNKNSYSERIKSILLTFGGVDEGNITLKVLEAIATTCLEENLFIEIVTGPGYSHHKALEQYITKNSYLNCTLVKKTNKISKHMLNADLAFTSGGRTVLELSALEVPTVVICQNERETTHSFASKENGIINLGYRENVSTKKIEATLKELISDPNLINKMKSKMQRMDLSSGKSRVIKLITGLLN